MPQEDKQDLFIKRERLESTNLLSSYRQEDIFRVIMKTICASRVLNFALKKG